VNEDTSALRNPLSVRFTPDARLPVAPPSVRLTGPALPLPKLKLVSVAVLFPSPNPLPSVITNARENGPAGLPASDDVSTVTGTMMFALAISRPVASSIVMSTIGALLIAFP
jgi:hypothetical protein